MRNYAARQEGESASSMIAVTLALAAAAVVDTDTVAAVCRSPASLAAEKHVSYVERLAAPNVVADRAVAA